MSGFWLGEPPEQPLTRQQVLDDLVGKNDIIRTLDIGEPRYRKWLERRDRLHIPSPLKVIGSTPIYSMQEWREWYGRWITRHEPDKGWRNTKLNGQGESFFTYWR